MTIDEAAAERIRAELAGLMAEFFRAVSFRPGTMPPYHLLHELFVAGGMLIRNNGDAPEITSVADFIAPRQFMVEIGELSYFEEVELGSSTEMFGNIAYRFSTYQKRGRMDGVDFAARGVISTQFVNTPEGWRMSAMAWDDERPGLSIPENVR
jgi:hypothetical protein